MKAKHLSPPLTVATTSARRAEATRLLVMDRAAGDVRHKHVSELPLELGEGDLLVVNDAATLPASLSGRHLRTGRSVELRLVSHEGADAANLTRWTAVLFGEGDWRTPTEARPLPACPEPGDELEFDDELRAKIVAVISNVSDRLIEIEFTAANQALLWNGLYRQGRPIQYSYLEEPLHIWDQQTLFSGPPVAIEPPSALFPFTWDLVFRLKDRGVQIEKITHATGISSTGDEAIDARLPFPERSWIGADVQAKIRAAKRSGRRVIAVGTGVARALETWGRLAGVAMGTATVVGDSFVSTLRLTSDSRRTVVDGILTGLHEPGASHIELLLAFTDRALLERGYAEALERRYLWHEYGDVCLIR